MRLKYIITAYPKYWLKYSHYSIKKVVRKVTGGRVRSVQRAGSTMIAQKIQRKKLTRNDLIDMESEYGKLIFGAVPKGHRREFFNLSPAEWVWHEEWPNEQGMIERQTIKYQITKLGILKIQVGKPNVYIEGEELRNFREAVTKYSEIVIRELYQDPEPATMGL
ncbi:MAG: hypothetical protein LBQ02_02995 [Candidatus Nomurabacteria bacterium]|jgi:hypothetical protein|nr:hypothetical protein [Candidatus Nomurabacteria bacterium]